MNVVLIKKWVGQCSIPLNSFQLIRTLSRRANFMYGGVRIVFWWFLNRYFGNRRKSGKTKKLRINFINIQIIVNDFYEILTAVSKHKKNCIKKWNFFTKNLISWQIFIILFYKNCKEKQVLFLSISLQIIAFLLSFKISNDSRNEILLFLQAVFVPS